MNIETFNEAVTIYGVFVVFFIIGQAIFYFIIGMHKGYKIAMREIDDVEIEISPKAYKNIAIAMNEVEAHKLMYGDTVQLNFKENKTIKFIIK